MAGLPSHSIEQCRRIFLRCREFQGYSALRTVFITDELRPFRIGLREADNSALLVDLNLEYLLEQRLRGGQPILPIFIAELCKKYDLADTLREDLDDLLKQTQDALLFTANLSTSANHHKLFDLILRLDFNDQARLARQVIESHRIASFLVHGQPDCGQRLLVTRLSRLLPNWQTAQRLNIEAGSNGTGKSSHSLWRQVAYKLSLPYNTPPIEIAEKVCHWLDTQDVIFIFQTVEYIPQQILAEWMRDFWQLLISHVRPHLHTTKRETRLLLFLVDYTGCVCEWDLPIEREFNLADYAGMPLQLPPAIHFSNEVLDTWISFAADDLPSNTTAKSIVELAGNGIPQIILEQICALCGVSWEGELTRWLV